MMVAHGHQFPISSASRLVNRATHEVPYTQKYSTRIPMTPKRKKKEKGKGKKEPVHKM